MVAGPGACLACCRCLSLVRSASLAPDVRLLGRIFLPMASFGWKRKIGEKVSRATSQQFEAEAADEKAPGGDEDEDWVHAAKRRKEVLLEDCVKKSKQLKDEGASLAENRSLISVCLLNKK
ncbi:tetratricopeptide repeat protein 33 [Meleagris gallopavo]|uniref:tetratricopeptide repeat protein 33 n=1 Tax=Meleagris gallopavo TaxID=9103 RepID=UPI000940119F|nr:tetratricopeptide repeat protein 33 [Meleagris gallopavo]